MGQFCFENMKCVITAAGLGTRLLPVTKEIPKEMLPIYSMTKKRIVMKPILQVIFESLYSYGIRDFCFIVGKTKGAVVDHFNPNDELVRFLKKNKKPFMANILGEFFLKLKKSQINFVYQSKPLGFGNAIMKARNFVGNEHFFLHAGDDIVISKNNNHLRRMEMNFIKYNADIACLIEQVDDPSRYGVVNGNMLDDSIIEIKEMEEKPKKPRSKNAIIAIYVFKPSIFKYLQEAAKYSHSEKQLAGAFNIAINKRAKVIGVMLKENERRIDIGTPESYIKVLDSLKNHN